MTDITQYEINSKLLEDLYNKAVKETNELEHKQSDLIKRSETIHNNMNNTEHHGSNKYTEEHTASLQRQSSLISAEQSLLSSRISFSHNKIAQAKLARDHSLSDLSKAKSDITETKTLLNDYKAKLLKGFDELEILQKEKLKLQSERSLQNANRDKLNIEKINLEKRVLDIRNSAGNLIARTRTKEQLEEIQNLIIADEDRFLNIAFDFISGNSDNDSLISKDKSARLTEIKNICSRFNSIHNVTDKLIETLSKKMVEPSELLTLDVDSNIPFTYSSTMLCIKGGIIGKGKLTITSFLILFEETGMETLCIAAEDLEDIKLITDIESIEEGMWSIIDPDLSSKDVSAYKVIEALKSEPLDNGNHNELKIENERADIIKSHPPSPKFELTITSPKLLPKSSGDPLSPIPITPFSPIPVQISILILYLKPSFMEKMNNLNSTNWSSEIHFQGVYNDLSIINRTLLHWKKLFQDQPVVAHSRRNSLTTVDSKISTLDLNGNLNVKQLEIEQVMEVSVTGESNILSIFQLKQVMFNSPTRFRLNKWKLVYALDKNGVSWKTFFTKAAEIRGTILIVKDHHGKAFGVFTSEPWKLCYGFYGSGESFVYHFNPDFIKYSWTGDNNFFMTSSVDNVAIGGGGNFALQIDKNMMFGSSGVSTTFNNLCLSKSEHFQIDLMELWGSE